MVWGCSLVKHGHVTSMWTEELTSGHAICIRPNLEPSPCSLLSKQWPKPFVRVAFQLLVLLVYSSSMNSGLWNILQKQANGQNVSIFCGISMAVLDHPSQPRLVCMTFLTLDTEFTECSWRLIELHVGPMDAFADVSLWTENKCDNLNGFDDVFYHCTEHTAIKWWFISLFFQIKSHHSQLVAHRILVFSLNVSVWFCNAFFPCFCSESWSTARSFNPRSAHVSS